MVQLLVENNPMPLAAFWYHYRRNANTGKQFKLIISLDESEVIKEIEEYAECRINDRQLTKKVLVQDSKNMSLGLIWRLRGFFEDKGYINTKSVDSIDWVINNIVQISVENDMVEIKGEVNNN